MAVNSTQHQPTTALAQQGKAKAQLPVAGLAVPQGQGGVLSNLPPNTQPCVLIIERDTVTGDALASYLEHYHPHQPIAQNTPQALRVLTATSPQLAEALLATLTPTQPLVLLADLATLKQADDSWLTQQRQRLPQLKLVLLSALWLEDCLADMQRLACTHLLTKTVPFDFAELSTLLHLLFNLGQAQGLAPYVPLGAEVTHITLRCSDDIMTAFFDLQAFFTETQVLHPDDLATAMIEAITNAVYHATPHPTTAEKDKYDKGQVIEQLEPDEWVTVSYASLGSRIALCVSDQKGRLSAEQVLYWLQRNFTGDNLLNTHGRGLFLMYTLCQRLSLHLHAGQRTDVVAIANTALAQEAGGATLSKLHQNKPLFIHTLG
jgi:anti-sigma regulatory factor (Ser/Thr protein kinase)